MSSHLEQRVLRLEQNIRRLTQLLTDTQKQIGRITQNQWYGGTVFQGGGGGVDGTYFCLPTSLGAATGTWPSLTPASQSLTVYQSSGTTLTSLGTKTVYNWYPAATVASKVLMVKPDGAGNYCAVSQSCT